jgi:endonuclease III-like uncharacterized protein
MDNQKQTVKSQVKELKENSNLKPKQILNLLAEKNVKTTLNSVNYYYYGKKGLVTTNA